MLMADKEPALPDEILHNSMNNYFVFSTFCSIINGLTLTPFMPLLLWIISKTMKIYFD